MALENGIDIKTLAEILGHNTVATALNTYTHSTAKMQESAARRIDRTIGGVNDEAEQKLALPPRFRAPQSLYSRRTRGKRESPAPDM